VLFRSWNEIHRKRVPGLARDQRERERERERERGATGEKKIYIPFTSRLRQKRKQLLMHVPRARNVFAWITNGANVFANTPLRDDLALALLAVRGGTILSACACAREHFLFTGKSTPSYEGRSCAR